MAVSHARYARADWRIADKQRFDHETPIGESLQELSPTLLDLWSVFRSAKSRVREKGRSMCHLLLQSRRLEEDHFHRAQTGSISFGICTDIPERRLKGSRIYMKNLAGDEDGGWKRTAKAFALAPASCSCPGTPTGWVGRAEAGAQVRVAMIINECTHPRLPTQFPTGVPSTCNV